MYQQHIKYLASHTFWLIQPWLQPNSAVRFECIGLLLCCSLRIPVMAKPNSKRRKRSDKFPLTLHKTGQYCKKIKGKLYYFWKGPSSSGGLEEQEYRLLQTKNMVDCRCEKHRWSELSWDTGNRNICEMHMDPRLPDQHACSLSIE